MGRKGISQLEFRELVIKGLSSFDLYMGDERFEVEWWKLIKRNGSVSRAVEAVSDLRPISTDFDQTAGQV
ncbi:hypothetical protein AAE478_009504 [Parahypoxylon ruwenzoriense]